jgi:hypothetical protein
VCKDKVYGLGIWKKGVRHELEEVFLINLKSVLTA